MESPVVVDKPPEYHGNASSNNERGFPFDEEEGTGAWSELAARHPDIAVRLRQRPATWARKRRPSSQDAADDFGDSFSGFDRFPFDDIPPEFREHFPSHWNRRFGSREEAHPQPSSPQPQQPHSPQQQTIATQTEEEPGPSQDEHTSLPNYGLRNTVDLGQKSAADPSISEAEDRNQRSMSAPPDNRTANQSNTSKMSGHQEQPNQPQSEFQSSNVRHIPIFVEGRDEPVINKSVDHGTHFGESKPTYVPPPPPPHVDREQYFADDVPHGFHHPPNFSRTFGTPFNKGFRQGPQPFVQQKVYPQTAFARGASPQRSQSPKPQMQHPEEHYVKVPVHHETPAPKTEPPSKPQPKQAPPRQQTPPQQPSPKQPPPKQPTPPPQPKPQPSANDPITQILSIQTDVLNLMTEVENFTGTKKDKKYIYLDEMLTRNLIKLDNIETDGKENIRQARKEAIKCIQKCIAVLEAKADNKGVSTPQPTQDVEMDSTEDKKIADETAVENGEVEMKENTPEESKEQPQDAPQPEQTPIAPQSEKESDKLQEEIKEDQKPDEEKKEASQPPLEKTDATLPEVADTRPEEPMIAEPQVETKQEEQKSQEKADNKKSPKKGTKTVKKRDKSKDKKDTKEQDSNKEEILEKKEEKLEPMQVDGKGDKTDSQTMEVDGAASQ